MKLKFISLLFAVGVAFDATAAQSLVTFSDGNTGGWIGRVGGEPGTKGSYVDSTLGDAAPALRDQYNDFKKIGLRYYSDSAAYAGNYTKASSITVSFDIDAIKMANGYDESGAPLTKDIYIDFLDHGRPTDYVDSSILSFKAGTVTQGMGWQHFSVTFDPRALDLGAGWTNNSSNSTQQILSAIDQLAIHIAPGTYWDPATAYDVALDNIAFSSISAVPEPDAVAMLLAGIGLIAGVLNVRRRTKR